MIMKIIYLHTTGNWWDHRYYHKQMPALRNDGYEVTYLISSNDIIDSADYRVINISKKSAKLARCTGGLNLLRIVMSGKYDAVQVCNVELLPLGIFLSIFSRIKVFYDCREDHYNAMLYSKVWFPKWVRVLMAYSVRVLETVSSFAFCGFIVSDPAIYKIQKQIAPEKKLLFYNMALLSHFVSDNNDRKIEKRYDLVVLGSMSIRTGVLDVVKALSLLKKEGIELKLKLIGDPSVDKVLYGEIKEVIKNADMEGQIYVTGKVPYSDVPDQLKDCCVAVIPLLDMPKFRNNIATKQFEYMASGLPIISTLLPPQQIFIEEGYNGVFYKAGDIEELISKIKYLKDNPQERLRMGENGRQRVIEEWNSEKQQEKYILFYFKRLRGEPYIEAKGSS